jgi:isopenicillin-N epimerase
LTLVENCTFAFNSVVGSMRNLRPDDKIFIFSTTYGVFKKILKHKCEETGACLVEEQIEFPILDENDLNRKTVAKLEAALEADKLEQRIKYIIVDHIPSNQPFLMPVQKLANVPRRDALLIVDAAHTLASFKQFNFESHFSNIDILFTNCHKWLCGPKGTGLLYRNERIRDTFDLKSAVLSHGFTSGFSSDFIWSGLKDYSAFLGLYSNLAIWTQVLGGFDRAIDFCTNLAREAAEYLRDTWSTSLLVSADLCGPMLCVQLPYLFICKLLDEPDYLSLNLDYDYAEKAQNFFYFTYRIEVPVKAVQNKLYVRISAHVYNRIEDFKRLGQVVADF